MNTSYHGSGSSILTMAPVDEHSIRAPVEVMNGSSLHLTHLEFPDRQIFTYIVCRNRLDEEDIHRIQSQPATSSNRNKILSSASGQKIVYIDVDPGKRDSNALLGQYRGEHGRRLRKTRDGDGQRRPHITNNTSKWQEGKA
jgi:hypothetical protein